MQIFTLCVGMGADAGDWPELGQWFHFSSLEAVQRFCEETVFGEDTDDNDKLQWGDWRNIDGDKPHEGEATGPGTWYNCLHWASDQDCEEDNWLADSVAKVLVGELHE